MSTARRRLSGSSEPPPNTLFARALIVTLALFGLGACPSAPVKPEASPPAGAAFPPAPIARPERPSLAPDAILDRRHFELDADFLVFPIEVAADARPGDADRALALSQLLVHAINANTDVFPVGLALAPDGQPLPPSAYAGSDTRYFVGGRLTRVSPANPTNPFELTLWIMDRVTLRVASRTVRPDLPRLLAPRNALADLMTDVELPRTEMVRADVTWYEDLDLAQLALTGALIRARHALDAQRTPDAEAALAALVARADTEAPWSYTAAVAVAEQLLPAENGCSPGAVTRLSRVLSLNRVLPFTLATYELTCALDAALVDPEAPTSALPAWSRRSSAHCRIGGKGMTSIASTRGGPTGQRDPDAGMVTGLGGVYRGDACDAGYAVMNHTPEELGPPIVRASLELEAAFYFYAERDLPKSTRWFNRALETARTPAPGGAATPCLVELLGAEAMLGLADLSVEDGRGGAADELLPAVRAIAERCSDPRMVGRTWNSEALLELNHSAFDKALKLFAKAHAAFERVADTTNLVVVDANIGVTWLHLGRVDKAIPHLERALAGKRRLLSNGGVGVLLENLGVAELARAKNDAAAAYFAEALTFTRDYHTLATLNVQLARLALARGDQALAEEHMNRARYNSVRAHSRVLEAIIEQTDAAVSVVAGRFDAALADFHEALAIRRALGDRAGEGITLSLLMAVSEHMGRPAIAILYGKLAIAAHEQVRAVASAVDPETAREFLATRADTYRVLANLLVAEGRLVEAERVLGLLKEDEVNQYTRAAGPSPAGVPLTVAERAIDKRYAETADQVMLLGREHSALAAKWPRSKKEEAELERLRKGVETANQRFSDFLASLAREDDALQRGRKLTNLAEDTSIGPDLADLGEGYVAVYTLVAKSSLNLIVVSADAQVARSVRIDERMLNGVVAAFRQAVQDPTRDPRPAARELYDLLIAPIEQDLVGANAKTILWSLDRSLRYVPMGALYDGQRYAIERWPMAVFTPASKARMKDAPQAQWRMLALGVAAAHPPFPALPAVTEELAGLVDAPDVREAKGVLTGLKALDQAFTKDLLLAQLSRRWPVVHLASHFSFQPGDKDESYLLLGDGSRLTVGELERLPNVFQGVDLLTLSACNTATGDVAGDGTEVESFAVLAQRKGARAVFASLWPVADQSTSALMRRFYQLHGSAPSKLEALRKAQLELLNATLIPAPGTTRARPLTLPGESAPDPSTDPLDAALAGWRHPYYWAPFILVGNVR